MGGTGGSDGTNRPPLPPGRHVMLPGRGRTFVRELVGPPGAPVLVLLHGWTATADLNWFACYAPLAERYRVIALDHRGHGRGIRSYEPFTLEQCTDDVAALARVLELPPFIPVGYSMGGPVAQLLWQRHPELVDGMVLCATSRTFTGSMRERLLFGVATGTSFLADALPLTRITNAALGAWNQWRHHRGCPWWGFDDVARHDWEEIVEAGRATLRFDSRPFVGQIDVPAAVVVTEGDDVVPVRRQMALAASLRDATVHRVHGGHAVCTTTPERFVPILHEACASVAARRGAARQLVAA